MDNVSFFCRCLPLFELERGVIMEVLRENRIKARRHRRLCMRHTSASE